jgi:hypothetical protein
MNPATTTLRRAYSFHGVAISVVADEPAAIDAIDLRLRDFQAGGEATGAPEITFAFVADSTAAARPVGQGRPVYETPHGTLDYYPEEDSLYGTFGGVTVRCDPAKGTVVLACEAFTGRNLYLATHPLLTVSLMELLERGGLYALHAACLASSGGAGVLIAGPSGAGKSTLTLALAHAGLSLVSDDVVFLDTRNDRLRVLGFADTLGLSALAAERFPMLEAAFGLQPADGFPKRLARAEEIFGVPSLPECEPVAIVFPTVHKDRASSIGSLAAGDALLRLVPDVLLTHPASSHEHLRAIATLLAQVRCHQLASGADLEQAARLVAELVGLRRFAAREIREP